MKMLVVKICGWLVVAIALLWLFLPVRCGNKMASMWENIAFVLGMDDAERREWTFCPDAFSLFDTNCIYTAAVEPKRALPYDIVLCFNERIKINIGSGRIDGYYRESMLSGMEVRVVVSHCDTQKVLKDVVVGDCKSGWTFETGTNDLARVECLVCSFCPHKGAWHYQDRLKVQVQMLRPQENMKPLCDKVTIVVREGYPLR